MEEIYIDSCNIGVRKVNKVKDLNDIQILCVDNDRYFIIGVNDLVTKENYEQHLEEVYKTRLKDFRIYLSSRSLTKSILVRMIDELVEEKVIKED